MSGKRDEGLKKIGIRPKDYFGIAPKNKYGTRPNDFEGMELGLILVLSQDCSYLALKNQYNYALPQIVYLALPRKYYLALFQNQLVYLALPLFPLVDIALIG